MPKDSRPIVPSRGAILTLDTGSPVVSVAVGRPPEVLAERQVAQANSSERLVAMIDEVLAAANVDKRVLEGIVVLQGPGSFTGLRIGFATAMGLHQALGTPATTIPTLEVLAACVVNGDLTVLAVVDALRGEWSAQPFRSGRPPQPLADARIEPAEQLPTHSPDRVVGFGASALLRSAAWSDRATAFEPESLAATTIRLLADRELDWSPAPLMDPLYLRRAVAQPAPGRK